MRNAVSCLLQYKCNHCCLVCCWTFCCIFCFTFSSILTFSCIFILDSLFAASFADFLRSGFAVIFELFENHFGLFNFIQIQIGNAPVEYGIVGLIIQICRCSIVGYCFVILFFLQINGCQMIVALSRHQIGVDAFFKIGYSLIVIPGIVVRQRQINPGSELSGYVLTNNSKSDMASL